METTYKDWVKKTVDYKSTMCTECKHDNNEDICHEKCECRSGKCTAINRQGFCKTCTHHTMKHELVDYVYVLEEVTKTFDTDLLKKQHDLEEQKMSHDEVLIFSYVDQLIKMAHMLEKTQVDMKNCNNYLK